jgi:hypothetical protein
MSVPIPAHHHHLWKTIRRMSATLGAEDQDTSPPTGMHAAMAM